MDASLFENCNLFAGIPARDLRKDLESVTQHIQCYDRGETVFFLMEEAEKIGIILEGSVESEKPFPNGSQVNVSIRKPGDMIGPAAAFSASRRYPCDVVALEPTTIMMFSRKDILALMQKDIRILENFTRELATATYMLQERIELFSYSGIAEKAAYYLLMQAKKSGTSKIRIPSSVSNWAMMMNVSRPSLHRELTKMEKGGMISYQPPFITINDPEALLQVLGK